MIFSSVESLTNRIVIAGDSAKLADMRRELYELAGDNEVPVQATRRMVLAVDEAISNVIEHGLQGRVSEIEIIVEFVQDEVIVKIIDDGIPFDPRPCRNLPNRMGFPKRGFGLYLIQLIADTVEYERTPSGKNVLTLTKRTE
jgi:anti-sigma regulatory factor (Ser/Thr protein kinase)